MGHPCRARGSCSAGPVARARSDVELSACPADYKECCDLIAERHVTTGVRLVETTEWSRFSPFRSCTTTASRDGRVSVSGGPAQDPSRNSLSCVSVVGDKGAPHDVGAPGESRHGELNADIVVGHGTWEPRRPCQRSLG